MIRSLFGALWWRAGPALRRSRIGAAPARIAGVSATPPTRLLQALRLEATAG
ncbi:MAG: hypothetical protein M3498_17675 [Deinococcota bacterium]|nr:hypothetical protein [Deinococcota bacterium]